MCITERKKKSKDFKKIKEVKEMKKNNLLRKITMGTLVVASTMVLTACGNNDVASRKDETTTKKIETTEKVTEETTENKVDNTKVIEKEFADGEYVNLFYGAYNGEKIKVGDYCFGIKLVNDELNTDDFYANEYNLYIERNGEDDIEVIQNFKYSQVPMHHVFTNGKEVIFGYKNEFCRYDIESKKCERTDINNTLNNIEKKEKNRVDIRVINDTAVFMEYTNCNLDEEGEEVIKDEDPIHFVVSYNLENRKAKCVAEDREIDVVDKEKFDEATDYMVTRHYVKESGNSSVYERYIEKINGDDLEEIKALGENYDVCDGNKNENKKIYFKLFKDYKKDKSFDETKFTLVGFDKESGKLEEVADFDAKDYESEGNDIYVTDVTDEYCIISSSTIEESEEGTVGGSEVINIKSTFHEKKFKYTYATKSIEKISEE